MKQAAALSFLMVLAASAPTKLQAQDGDESFKAFAIKAIHDRPLGKPAVASAVYLGNGGVLTAAHVVGRLPSFLSNQRVLIAGQELAASVLKQGSFDKIDLAVLYVDEQQLPVSYRLRRNPLCNEAPSGGDEVVAVVSNATIHSRIMFPQALPPEFRATSNTFIDDLPVPGGSGAGVYHAERKCLLGILSSRVSKRNFRVENGRTVRDLSQSTVGLARHFVPASVIAKFMSSEFRFDPVDRAFPQVGRSVLPRVYGKRLVQPD